MRARIADLINAAACLLLDLAGEVRGGCDPFTRSAQAIACKARRIFPGLAGFLVVSLFWLLLLASLVVESTLYHQHATRDPLNARPAGSLAAPPAAAAAVLPDRPAPAGLAPYQELNR